MILRALGAFVLLCFACAGGGEDLESRRGGSPYVPAGGVDHTQRSEDPIPPMPPLCPPIGGTCIEGFALTLEASEPWPLGRYFLRVALNRRPPSVCEIAFEPVVGAVTDTCNGPEREFRVAYRYDHEARAIDGLSFGLVSRVDMEILVAESLPPVVEVHHNVVVQKCSYACELAAPLLVRVNVGSATESSSADAGEGDAGDSVLDAAVDATP
jgi:hypothetical protein